MILRELYELYDRLVAAGADIPRKGRSLQSISFRIVLTPTGELVKIEDARSQQVQPKGNVKLKACPMFVPFAKGRTSGVVPYFLCDKAEYMLGYGDKAEKKWKACVAQHLKMETSVNTPEYSAVCRFLRRWTPVDWRKGREDERIDVDLKESDFGVFRIQGSLRDVHDDDAICRWWDAVGNKCWWGTSEDDSTSYGRCLVTNAFAPIARLHAPAFKGFGDKQTKLVSFNCDSFNSYGYKQNFNAPVSEDAAFKYCNALNYLLSRKENHVRLGESIVVFWTDAPPQEACAMEEVARWSFDPQELTIENSLTDENLLADVRLGLQEIARGKAPSNALKELRGRRFFILGLSPNAARLSVRFYHESTFGEFLQHLRKHYEGLSLVKRAESFKDPDVISPFMILRESVRDINKELPPASIGHLMNAILSGSPYPDMLAMSILRRFKADGNINYIRCAFLKAWLIRNHHLNITTMLDSNNTQPGYLLGRLFAILVKTQEDALGKNLNRTLRDSYYSSASSTPRVVFPRLMRLFQHHLSKLDGGLKTARDKQMQEVMWLLNGEFPAHLTQVEQGAFVFGYYHQMQAFYTPSAHKDVNRG